MASPPENTPAIRPPKVPRRSGEDLAKDGASRIDTLHLENYRTFQDLSLDLHPRLTVLVAANGGGKTAILDAIVSAWALFFGGLGVDARAARFAQEDVRRVLGREHTMEPALPARIHVTGLLDGLALSWGQAFHATGAKARLSHTQGDAQRFLGKLVRKKVSEYAEGTRATAPTLPLVCYYGTGRLWNTRARAHDIKTEQADTSRLSGYTDCLAPTSSFQFFESWFRRFGYEAQNEITSSRPSPHMPAERLAGVRRAVDHLLAPSGWQRLEWDFAEDTLVASHPEHGRLPVRQLSDGIRNMIGLVGDIAHRAVRLNPHLGADAYRKTPGLVLIDEVDMHLHPGWQQTVLESLQRAFPEMQMIVTTHSPHVLSTVDVGSIRVIHLQDRRTVVETPTFQTRGADSAGVLANIMGVDPVPQVAEAAWLTEYRVLVQSGRWDEPEGRDLLRRLTEHFGEEHPVMQELATLRRLQEFKRLHHLHGEAGVPHA